MRDADDAPDAGPAAFATLDYAARGAVAWVRLNRPRAMNALNPAMVAELGVALARAESTAAIRALVVTGSGAAFCAGADLKSLLALLDEPDGVGFETFLRDMRRTFDAIEASPLPVIAAVNGLALAGGLELLLCCDLVVAAESARLGDAHANYGLVPGAGSTQRLTRRIGLNRAKMLMFTADFVPAAELLATGLVNRVVADAALEASVQALGEQIATRSPLGIRRMKALANAAADTPLPAGLEREIEVLLLHRHSHDMREGLEAFQDKRTPQFDGT